MIFYNEKQAVEVCIKNPKLIFELIKEGYIEVVDKVLEKDKNLINTIDDNGNSVMMKLLLKKHYDIVLKHMKNEKWDVNFRNDEGNTFSHILVVSDYLKVSKIFDRLVKNKKFIPNIRNNKNQTILDRALLSNELLMATKILKNRRFNNIDILSFKYMYDKYIMNSFYGKYTKINNFDIIISNLEKKDSLKPRMKKLLYLIKNNIDDIKKEILNNQYNNMYLIIESVV